MLLAPFLWIFCEFDEKVLDNLSLDMRISDSWNLTTLYADDLKIRDKVSIDLWQQLILS